MTKDDAIKLALEALEFDSHYGTGKQEAITALREALAEQPAQQEPVAWEVGVVNGVVTRRLASPASPPAQQCKWPTCQREDYQQALAEQVKRELVGEQPAQREPEQGDIFCGVDFTDGMLSVSVLRRRADDVAELLHAEQIELPAQPQPAGLLQEIARLHDRIKDLEKDVEFLSLPAQQEPVACVQDLDEVKRKHLVYEKGMDWKDPLYTSPSAQQCKWPTCQSDEYQQALAEQIKRELVGDQPEQEPVAWWNQSKDSVSTDPVHRHNSDCQPLYTKEQL